MKSFPDIFSNEEKESDREKQKTKKERLNIVIING